MTNNKKRFLFVSKEALIGDLVWKIKNEGHEVKYFIESKTEKDICDGFVDKVDKWEDFKDWADVIIFDDVGFGTLAEKLRKEGKLVVGGSVYTDKLEVDRDFAVKEMIDAGVNVIPSWIFTDFDEAIKFINKNPDRYVIKPSGIQQEDQKELLFVGGEEDGKDVIQVLELYKLRWSKKIKTFQLQKFISGVEVAAGAFFNGEDFIYPINVNFEHKKLFPGNIGPSTGEMGCYDDETEVLTNNGWKFFKELNPEDEICTLNPLNNVIEFHKPYVIVSFNHHKKLVSIQNRTLDINVTPDHNMYVSSQCDARNGRNNFKFVKARELEYQSLIKRTGTWLGIEQEYFTLPSVVMGHYEGRQVIFHQTGEIKIPMDTWSAFMGIWLSDGYVSNSKVGIVQKTSEKTEMIERLLSQLPFKFSKRENEFYLYNKQLSSYLMEFGKAYEKYIPHFIKELSPRQIGIFLEWFSLGDGTLMRKGFRIFYTSSKRMADDIQELLLKVGRVGVIKSRRRNGKVWIENHFANVSRVQYEVLERVRKLSSWIDKRDIKVIDYDGMVYCACVRNHVMYVRRNGKPYWCGNTSMYWSQPNTIFNETLLKMKEKLKQSGYVGYIDINCIVNGRGIYPLEFTSRFGYPTISIQIEGVMSEWGEFLYALAKKEKFDFKTKKGFQVGVVIAVPPFPFTDPDAFKRYSEDATIIFKKPNLDGIRLGEVKLVNGDFVLAGISGYALIIVGTGTTMEEAKKAAYNKISNVIIPNMFYRTDIGERWFTDSDKLFAWGYI
jgi:phosphoribosylamine-glycine ligase